MSERQKIMDRDAANRCPLCAAENQCAVAAGSSPESCWCHTAGISPAALAALPRHERMVRCLCPDCAGATESV